MVHLSETVMALGICVALPVSVVLLVTRLLMNNTNKRTELLLAALDKNPNLDVEEFLCKMAPRRKTIKDKLLRRLELSDIALATAADAMASVLLEQVCDALEAEQRAYFLQQRGLYLTGRYAPGYGDCPLALNDELCLAIDTVRGCGLAVTEQHLLSPRKSTTAILGAADHPVTGYRAGCATCHLQKKCAYRKRGITCADS